MAVITLISPFSILFFTIFVASFFFTLELDNNKLTYLVVLGLFLLALELNFKLFVRPFSFLDKFIPEEFLRRQVLNTKEALLGTFQMVSQVVTLLIIAAVVFLSFSIYEIKRSIDTHEIAYIEAETDFAENGAVPSVREAFNDGLEEREDDRRWLLLKVKYFIAKEQFSTALDACQVYKDGFFYPAIDPDNFIVKTLRKYFAEQFEETSHEDDLEALSLLLSSREFAIQKSYINFVESYLTENPNSLIAYLAIARHYSFHRTPERLKTNLEAIYEETQSINSSAIESQIIAAMYFYYQKDFEKAQEILNELLQQDSIYRAEIRIWLKRAEKALEA